MRPPQSRLQHVNVGSQALQVGAELAFFATIDGRLPVLIGPERALEYLPQDGLVLDELGGYVDGTYPFGIIDLPHNYPAVCPILDASGKYATHQEEAYWDGSCQTVQGTPSGAATSPMAFNPATITSIVASDQQK